MAPFRLFLSLGLGILALGGGFFILHTPAPTSEGQQPSFVEQVTQQVRGIAAGEPNPSAPRQDTSNETPSTGGVKTSSMGPKVYSYDELVTLADNKYANGNVPLGDYKYTTSGAKKGYVYLCNARKDNAGSMVDGPWIKGSTWNFLEKVSVSGSVSWPQAYFTQTISGLYRVLSGNGLPIDHTTGVFPVQSGTDAAKYDPNPNTISAQTLKENIPASPIYHDTPNCIGGEVGVMLTGVRLFNGFDAGLRDAPAHELQDSCDGHPQGSGQYHYHSLSACFKDTSVKTVLGFAYDGFPITGPKVAANKYLTTEDLDECHGITSEIVLDGKRTTTYHYVMTQDFPYSVSCFRGTSSFKPQGGGQPQGGGGQSSQPGGSPPAPPQEAISACSGKSPGAQCSVGGQVQGTCTTIGTYFACKP